MHVVHIKKCRACGSQALTEVIDLGEQYLQGSFVKPGKEIPPRRKISLKLIRCDPTIDENACGLLQLAHTVPPAILYASYWYRSGTNRTMSEHLAGIAQEASKFISAKEDVKVLDIGCNDGTLLKSFPKSFEKVGVDPSDIAKEISDDIKVIQDLFPSLGFSKKMQGEKRFKIVTSIAMFYDLQDPVSFVRAVKDILQDDGIWIFEMSYMPKMLALNSYDTICHEHLEYYSLAVIERILALAGMKVINATLNDSNGGSIRCYATHVENFRYDSSKYLNNLMTLRQKEFDLEIDTDKPYKDFQESITKHRQKLTTLLKDLKRKGKVIHIYGASTKGNTILQFCGIDNKVIDYAAERNPDKYGAKTLGTNIQIISEAKSRAKKPDYYLVLPWHFKKEFLERESKTLKNGIGMIFPLPKVEIINK